MVANKHEAAYFLVVNGATRRQRYRAASGGSTAVHSDSESRDKVPNQGKLT